MSKLSVIGIGPGNPEEMTPRAREAIEKAEWIVSYQYYADLVRDLFPEKQYYTTGMLGEIDRAVYAVSRAREGISVAVICSGDAEVYGMAPLVFEAARRQKVDLREIEIIPGITAALSCGAVLGAPLSCDFAVISLSDRLIPWDRIKKRLTGAARADLPMVLYNPGSRQRRDHLSRACKIIGKYKKPETVCAIVRNAGRDGQSQQILSLSELEQVSVDMFCTVFIGSSDTKHVDSRMVTPRGYEKKYDLSFSPADSPGPEPGASPLGSAEEGRIELLIFGGTTEGRRLAEISLEEGYQPTLSVASEYGREIVENTGARFRILSGKMPEDEIREQLTGGRYTCVIDATHPYAEHISGSILRAASAAQVRCIRIRRETETSVKDRLFFSDMESVIAFLNRKKGNVFFSTGSNASEQYMALRDLADRGYIRILPSETALAKVKAAGFRSSHILCMQGPFTEEMNKACFNYSGAEWLVTKASGKEGGYDEKITAAEKLGMKILVLRPPEYREDVQVCSYREAVCLIRGKGL